MAKTERDKPCKRLEIGEDRVAAHKAKMARKAADRAVWYKSFGNVPAPDFARAGVNRHTGEAHVHARAVTRRLRQEARV